MTKADAEIIKMLLWLVMCTVSTNPYSEAIALIGMGIHAIAAVFATFAEVGK